MFGKLDPGDFADFDFGMGLLGINSNTSSSLGYDDSAVLEAGQAGVDSDADCDRAYVGIFTLGLLSA